MNCEWCDELLDPDNYVRYFGVAYCSDLCSINGYHKLEREKMTIQEMESIGVPKPLTFSEYQKKAHEFADYPKCYVEAKSGWYNDDTPIDWVYPLLGLCGEASEVSEKLKKIIRDKNGLINKEDLEKIKPEIGDLAWYVAELCTSLGIDLGEVAKSNLIKLQDRKDRNKIHGEGDTR